MLTVTKIFTFDASHNLPYYKGPCHNLHGHTYKLEVTVSGDIQEDKTKSDCGMIIDFSELKRIVNDTVISKYDHNYLNNFFENPTAEIMVRQIAKDIENNLPKSVILCSVKLWEKIDGSYAEYNKFMGI